LGPFKINEEKKVFWKSPRGHIHNTPFTLKLKYGPNKLKCYALAILSSQVFGNTLAYRTIRKLQRKWYVVNVALKFLPFSTGAAGTIDTMQ
jgi:hypothetical protein